MEGMNDFNKTMKILGYMTKETITDEEAKEYGHFIHDSMKTMMNSKLMNSKLMNNNGDFANIIKQMQSDKQYANNKEENIDEQTSK